MRNTVMIFRLFGFIAWSALFASTASAQVFGGRGNPQPFSGAPNPINMGGTTVTGSTTGSLIPVPQQGIDRFLRTSRVGRDFVGRNRADIKSFIGSQQALAIGQVRSATDGLKANTGAAAKKINQPLPAQPAKGMYYPKLVLDLESASSRSESSRLEGDAMLPIESPDIALIKRLRRIAGEDVQLVLTGNKATISGRATSKRSAELAAQILEFEPGIDVVENQLR